MKTTKRRQGGHCMVCREPTGSSWRLFCGPEHEEVHLEHSRAYHGMSQPDQAEETPAQDGVCAAHDCDKPIDNGVGAKETKFCSNACRQRAYRRRQALRRARPDG